MSVYSSSAPIRVWIAPQSGGLRAAATTGFKWLPHDSIDIPTHSDLILPQYHTGLGNNLPGILGRKGGNACRGQFPIFPSGTAGTAPDSDVLLQGCFGVAPTIAAGVSVTYNPAFATLPFTLSRYNRIDSASSNNLAWGVIPSRVTFNIGGNGYFMAVVEMMACYVLSSDGFSAEDTVGKAGLSAFPAEPSGAAANGNMIPAFGGNATFGGTAVAEFVSAQLELAPNAQVRNDGFIDRYGFAAFPGKRTVTLKSLKFADSNGAALATVKVAAQQKTPMTVVLTHGAGAGYTLTHTLKGVQFGDATFTDSGNALDCDFGDAPASVSAYTALDDYTLAFT